MGRVTWAGPDSGVAVGDRVFCTISRIEGLAEGYGGHVLEAPVHRDQLYAVPADGPPPEAYSGLVLTQVGYNCGVRPTIAAGDPAVVIGDGMVGQWAAQTLQQRGARVLLLGRHPDRLQRLPLAAGDAVVNTRETDDLEAVKAWAPDGVQAIIDSVGSVATLNRLFWTLRRDGHLVSAGFNGRDSLFDLQLLRFREATVHAPSGWSRQRLEATLDWVHQGRLDTLGLVTHRFPADRAVEAWDAIRGQHDTTLGVLLDWREVTA